MNINNLFKAIGFTILMLIVYFAVSFGLIFALGIIFLIINYPIVDYILIVEKITSNLNQFVVPVMIATNIITLTVVMLIFLGRKDKFINYVGFRKIRVSDGFLILAFGGFFNILITGLLDLAIKYFPIGQQMKEFESLMEPIMNSGLIMILIAVSISAPIFEEIIFRGIILNDFKKVFPVWAAILVQAILFGVFHGNLIQGVYATILGIILGFIYYKYKSIWAVILLHFSYNTTSLFLDQWLHNNLIMQDIILLGIGGSILIAVIMIRSFKRDTTVTS
ncbi:MAG: type II CAAX endopeptidase family protein [Firmicutes bacterium]|nr:type II CAAX endopeptidase family protein [Bacillota bacterium]